MSQEPQASPPPLPDPYGDEIPETTGGLPAGPVMERPHPLTPVIKGWMGLVGMAVYLGRDRLEHADDRSLGTQGLLVLGGLLLAYVVVTAVIGYFSWRFTRFVIDDEQVRLEHNFVQHHSDKVPFTKIQSVDVVQPFAARLLGLAQLRIDVGSGRPKTIDYLSRERAYRMRDYLVARAHGRRVGVAEHAEATPLADALHDRSADDEVLLQVPPQRLVLAAVLSTNFLVMLLPAVALLVASGLTSSFDGLRATLVPVALGLVGVVSTHVVKQWNYSLLRSGGALKVSRGMTSLVSQTLPTNRIQGIAVTQHLLWRPFGIFRVQMDVLGYGGAGDDQEGGSDILLPAGSWQEVAVAIDAVWPGFRIDDVEVHRSPARARWLAPLAWGWMGWGRTDEVVLSRHGVLVRRVQMVHHARVQSVALHQGPVQRRLHLARLDVHTSKGPVDLTCHQLDEQLARELLLQELDLSRAQRRREAERAALAALPAPVVDARPDTVAEAQPSPVEDAPPPVGEARPTSDMEAPPARDARAATD